MLKKVKSFVQNPGKKGKVAVAMSVMLVMTALFSLFVFAADASDGGMSDIINALLDVILKIFFYIGILLLAWSVGMLVLAFKNEDADSKSRSMMLLVVSIALIGLKPLLEAVVPELTAPTW